MIASVGLLERRIINCNTAGPLGSLQGRDGFQRPPCLTHSVPACVLRKRTTATKRTEDALDDVGLANFPLHQVSLLTKYVLLRDWRNISTKGRTQMRALHVKLKNQSSCVGVTFLLYSSKDKEQATE